MRLDKRDPIAVWMGDTISRASVDKREVSCPLALPSKKAMSCTRGRRFEFRVPRVGEALLAVGQDRLGVGGCDLRDHPTEELVADCVCEPPPCEVMIRRQALDEVQFYNERCRDTPPMRWVVTEAGHHTDC